MFGLVMWVMLFYCFVAYKLIMFRFWENFHMVKILRISGNFFLLIKGIQSQMEQCSREILPKPKSPELRARTIAGLFSFLPSGWEADNTHRSCFHVQRLWGQIRGWNITTVIVPCWGNLHAVDISCLLPFPVFSTGWIKTRVDKHFHVA